VVAAGDTLSSLAKAHGVSIDQLLAANHLSDPNQLSVGQTLVLSGAPAAPPAPVPTAPIPVPTASQLPAAAIAGQVTVASGQTLTAIAQANHVDLGKLASVNHIGDPGRIFSGQVLKLN